MICWRTEAWTTSPFFFLLTCKTKRFQVTVGLYSHSSEKKPKYGKNITETKGALFCLYHILMLSVIYYNCTNSQHHRIYLLSESPSGLQYNSEVLICQALVVYTPCSNEGSKDHLSIICPHLTTDYSTHLTWKV